MHLLVRLFLCASLLGSFAACSSTNRPSGQSGDRDASADSGTTTGPDSGALPDAGGTRPDGGRPPQAGTDDPPATTTTGPTSIYPSGGSATGRSDNYRLQVVVGAPAPMNEGSSDSFKLRIGARLQ